MLKHKKREDLKAIILIGERDYYDTTHTLIIRANNNEKAWQIVKKIAKETRFKGTDFYSSIYNSIKWKDNFFKYKEIDDNEPIFECEIINVKIEKLKIVYEE